MFGRERGSAPSQRRVGWQGAALAVACVAVTGMSVLAVQSTNADPPAPSSDYRPYTPQPEPGPAQSAPINRVFTQLRDKSAPVTILALGDSTTAALETNWLNLTAQWLGRRYDRPVVLHPWSQAATPPRYVRDYTYPGGSGKPIEVWSAAASGMNADYTLSKLREMAPMPTKSVDWVIVNHGHNHGEGELFEQGGHLIDESIARWPQAPVTVIEQNPETVPVKADVHAQNLNDLAEFASTRGATVIDVYDAFKAAKGWRSMIDATGIHPTPAGYALWARTVQDWIAARARG